MRTYLECVKITSGFHKGVYGCVKQRSLFGLSYLVGWNSREGYTNGYFWFWQLSSSTDK